MRARQVLVCTVIAAGLTAARIAPAQTDSSEIPKWAAIVHQLALKAPQEPMPEHRSTGVFPPTIPEHLLSVDRSGAVATYNTNAPTYTDRNAFFQSLGTNGRACATCHEPRSGWGVSAASIRQRFSASHGTDPIFRVVDGATCDTDDVSSFSAKRAAYNLLLSKASFGFFCHCLRRSLGPVRPRREISKSLPSATHTVALT